MRRFLYLTAVTLSIGIPASVFAQGGGGGFGGGGMGGGGGLSSGGGLSGGGSSISGGGLSGSGSSFSGGGGLSGSGSSFSGSGTTTFGGGSGGTSFGGGGGGGGGGRGASGSSSFQVSPTNPFAGTFASPLYYGRPGSTTQSMGSGGQQLKGSGFGQPSFGTVTTTTGTTGAAGRTGTAGISNNRGLTGGVGGMNSSATPQVSYTAMVRFAPAPVISPTFRADLQGVIGRSSAIRVPGNVRVEAVGDTIVLRGKVADEDERRLAEGLIWLEPGVNNVRNELEVGP
jgi:BON domain